MTSAKTITTADIRALRSEARAAGDSMLAQWCDIALVPHETCNGEGGPLYNPDTGEPVTRAEAREVCVDAIRAAAAMAD